jgi:outer membrane protein insertion porin family
MRCWIFIIIVVIATSRPSSAQQSSKVSYEGQRVGRVDVISNPYLPVDAVRPLIAQKANEPYSAAQVQATIEAIKKTGRFSNVELTVKPESGGLHLTFTLEPALYFGLLTFPGATKVFTYSRLLQVADIQPQTAYKRETVATAGGALLNYFLSLGYFQALVQAETQFDNDNLLANVTFHVNLGKRAKLGTARVVGPPPSQAQEYLQDTRGLRATLTGAALKPGKTYTSKRLNSAVKLIKRDLTGEHRLANRVDLATPAYHPATNRADVTIQVKPGPIVNVSLTGAKLSSIPFLASRRLKKLVPIFSEGTVDPDLVEEGRRNLVDYFQSKGYFDVGVTTKFQQAPDKVDLVYEINRGPRQSVAAISFRGNQSLAADELAKQVAVKPHKILSRGKYSDKLLKQSVRGLTAFYNDHGYEDVKITPDVVHRDRKIYVAFAIDEGEQTLVESLNLEGVTHVPVAALTPAGGFRLRDGRPFSPRGLSDDRSHIMAAYLDHGFLNSEFDSRVSRDPNDQHKVNVTYAITEKQQVFIDDVILLGQDHTRERLIRKTADLRPEAALSQGKMLEAESALYDLGVFDFSSVDPKRPITDQPREDLLVRMHEARRNVLTYGFGLEIARRGGNVPSGTIALPGLPPISTGGKNFTSSENTFVSPRGSIEYTRNNVRGLAETLSVSALFSRLDQRAVTTYTDPRFRLSGWNSLFSASVERTTENPVFEARLAEGSWQLEKPLNKDKSRRVQLRYRFRRTVLSNLTIPDLVLPQDQRLRLSTVSATWIRDTRDKPLDASRGFYQTLDLALTPKAFGSNFNFARLLGQSSYYKSIAPNTVWANRITLGLAKSFAGSSVPTSERFFSGGETTLRGFPINGAGPQRTVRVCSDPSNTSTCTNINVPVGGNQLFIFNSELRFPLGIKEGLGAAAFYDGGNVYAPVNISQFVRNYSNTVGLGLRYSTPVGPVRIDVGRNLNPVPGIKATQFFITLGQAF